MKYIPPNVAHGGETGEGPVTAESREIYRPLTLSLSTRQEYTPGVVYTLGRKGFCGLIVSCSFSVILQNLNLTLLTDLPNTAYTKKNPSVYDSTTRCDAALSANCKGIKNIFYFLLSCAMPCVTYDGPEMTMDNSCF